MVEMDALAIRPIDKVRSAAGYICEGCSNFNTLYVTTNSLTETLRKLERMDVGRKDFYWHFGKALKKALGVQRINNGSI
jgi:hypothetical protein